MAVIKNDEIFVGGASSPVKVGIKLNGKEESGTQVVANPELTGEEEALTGLEIDETKYKIAGKKIYAHAITICDNLNQRMTASLLVVSDRATAYTMDDLVDYFLSLGIINVYNVSKLAYGTGNYYPATNMGINAESGSGTVSLKSMIGLCAYANASGTEKKIEAHVDFISWQVTSSATTVTHAKKLYKDSRFDTVLSDCVKEI